MYFSDTHAKNNRQTGADYKKIRKLCAESGQKKAESESFRKKCRALASARDITAAALPKKKAESEDSAEIGD